MATLTDIAETLRNKVTEVLPLNNPKVSKLFACVAPAEEEAEFADDDDSFYSAKSNNQENAKVKTTTTTTLNEQMRSVITTTFNKKFRCNGEDDADTKLTENDNGSSYYDDYSANRTVGLNTVDERNDVNGSRILGANNNATNRAYKQSFKDKYVQMKKSQQFAIMKSEETRKPSLSINAGQAVKDYDNAKIEKQRRAQLAEQKALEVLENAALRTGDPRSPSMALRAPIDP